MKHLKITLYYLLIIFITYTLTNKVLDFKAFQFNILRSSFFPENFTGVISYFAITVEITSILLLIFYKNRGMIFTFFMFIVFTVYIIILYILNKYEVCGCGGILNGLSFKYHLIINILLILISYYLINTNEKNEN